MTRKLLLTLAALLCCLPALAALDPLENSLELGLNQVTLPAHAASQVVVRRCGDCDPLVLPVNGDTRYFLRYDQPAVPLDQFLAKAADRPRDGLVVVFYRPDNRTVTRIVLGG